MLWSLDKGGGLKKVAGSQQDGPSRGCCSTRKKATAGLTKTRRKTGSGTGRRDRKTGTEKGDPWVLAAGSRGGCCFRQDCFVTAMGCEMEKVVVADQWG